MYASVVSRLVLAATVSVMVLLAQCNVAGNTSVALNPGLRVWLDQPPNGASLPVGLFPLKAHARDSAGGGIERVVFLVNTIPLGTVSTDTTQPLVSAEFGWNPATPGEYRLQAQAFGRNGSALSEIVVVCVGPSCPEVGLPITPTPANATQQTGCKGTPVIASFAVSPSSVAAGGGVATLSWSTSNADIIEIAGIGPVSPSGSQGITIKGTITVTLYAMCGGKENMVEKSVTINVAGAPQVTCSGKPVITSFTALPTSITSGGTSTLNWVVTNADRVEMADTGQVGLSGSRAVSPRTNTTYTLIAYCGGKENYVDRSLSVTVTAVAPPTPTRTPTRPPAVSSSVSSSSAQPPPPKAGCSGTPNISSFNISSEVVTQGSQVTLSWGAVTNADSVSIDQGIGGVAAPGATTVTVNAPTTYTLTARCGGNVATRAVKVTINVPQPPADKVPPTISNIKPSASNLFYITGCGANSLTITASVSDSSGVGTVQLFYRYVPQKGSASGWIPVSMNSVGGNDYSASVPLGNDAYKALGGGNGQIEYYITASDKLGNSGSSGSSFVTISYCPG